MCREGEVRKVNKTEESKEKIKEKDKIHKVQDGAERVGNGWRDILDELDYSSGPGDNIYVFG